MNTIENPREFSRLNGGEVTVARVFGFFSTVDWRTGREGGSDCAGLCMIRGFGPSRVP
jgi:hypothetical protein